MKIQNENYLTIQGWMITELGLKGNDLICYAIIYGFSQITGQAFNGSVQYLADWCNSTKRGIFKNLDNLINRGLIIKKDIYINNVKYCFYNAIRPGTKFQGGDEQSSPGVMNKVHQGGEQSSPNNIDNNIDNRWIDYNIELQKIFEEKDIAIIDIMPESQQEIFFNLQQVIAQIYKSPTYKNYINMISFDDLKNVYERYLEASSKRYIKNQVAYMKRSLIEICRKRTTM